MSRSLMESTVYNPKQLLWFIILYFRIDVHSCLAVFMSCKILNCLWINSRIEKIGDVSVPQLVRGHIKIQTIYHLPLWAAFSPRTGLTVCFTRFPSS